jgi:hypothetical protein
MLALTFAAEATFAVVHLATGARYFGFTHLHNVVIDVSLATIWTASALAALFHRSWAGFFTILVGASVSIVHGVMYSIALTQRGPFGVTVPFLLGAAVQFYLAVHAAPVFLQPPVPRAEAAPAPAWGRRRPAWLLRLRQSH